MWWKGEQFILRVRSAGWLIFNNIKKEKKKKNRVQQKKGKKKATWSNT